MEKEITRLLYSRKNIKKWTLLSLYSDPPIFPVAVAKSLRDLHQAPKITVQAKKSLFRPLYLTESGGGQIKNLRFKPKFNTIQKVPMVTYNSKSLWS